MPPDWYGRALFHIIALIAVALAMLAVPLHAQPSCPLVPHVAGAQDTVTLTQHSSVYAEVEYFNSTSSSTEGRTVSDGDMSVTVRILQTPGAERLIVQAPEGWVATPDRIDVDDCDPGWVELHRGEFLGM